MTMSNTNEATEPKAEPNLEDPNEEARAEFLKKYEAAAEAK